MKLLIVSLALFLSAGCQTTAPRAPAKPGAYTTYEHEMLKAWEGAGKKFEAGEYREALESYQKFMDQYPYSRWNTMAYYFLGECHERLRDYQQARILYRSVMDKYPGSVWADLARDRMMQLP
ncbi:MAG: tetratricopeptide repeat protein [Candidatus Omnitrophica bacterium]|nr:tetratricopeptide repeat protein [Candidatus Omnitrophota bacterium]